MKAELPTMHTAATAARYIVYESELIVDLLDEMRDALIEAKQLKAGLRDRGEGYDVKTTSRAKAR